MSTRNILVGFYEEMSTRFEIFQDLMYFKILDITRVEIFEDLRYFNISRFEIFQDFNYNFHQL